MGRKLILTAALVGALAGFGMGVLYQGERISKLEDSYKNTIKKIDEKYNNLEEKLTKSYGEVENPWKIPEELEKRLEELSKEINEVKNKNGHTRTLASKQIQGNKYYFFSVATFPTLTAIGDWLLKDPEFHAKNYKIDLDVRGAGCKPYKQRGENLALWVQFSSEINDDTFIVDVYDIYFDYIYYRDSESKSKVSPNWVSLYSRDWESIKERNKKLSKSIAIGDKVRFNEDYLSRMRNAEDKIWVCRKIENATSKISPYRNYHIATIEKDNEIMYIDLESWLVPAQDSY